MAAYTLSAADPVKRLDVARECRSAVVDAEWVEGVAVAWADVVGQVGSIGYPLKAICELSLSEVPRTSIPA